MPKQAQDVLKFFAIGLNLDVSKASLLESPNGALAIVGQVIADLNSASKELRAFIDGIGLDEQMESDLPGSLHSIATAMGRLYQPTIQVSCTQGAARGIPIPQQLRCLFIAKEAISNSFCHSLATDIAVSLHRIKNMVRRTVGDNGRDFQLQAAAGLGDGPAGWRRAHRLGGTLSVRSQLGKGTRVVQDLPQAIA
jgi:signal transduction histidine kinase